MSHIDLNPPTFLSPASSHPPLSVSGEPADFVTDRLPLAGPALAAARPQGIDRSDPVALDPDSTQCIRFLVLCPASTCKSMVGLQAHVVLPLCQPWKAPA